MYLIVSKKYATLLELDRDYSIQDAYDYLEIIDADSALEAAQHKDAEAQQPKKRQ